MAGCGGGYDVLSGMSLYFALRAQGKNVTLANLSFTNLPATGGKELCSGCFEVTSSTKPGKDSYFPELYLAKWLAEKGEQPLVYAFERRLGVKPLTQAYQHIIKKHGIDAFVLVDGGTDSVMFGNEIKMGTPTEDHCSMAAACLTSVPIKLLTCLGFGVDTFHGVSHGLFLENVAALEKSGGYLGCFSVASSSQEGDLYIECYKAVSQHMQPSIVCTSIIDGMCGEFGDHHSTTRTSGSQLFINPLMSIYWTFDLQKIVDRIQYLEKLNATETNHEIRVLINSHTKSVIESGAVRAVIPLPM